MSQNKTLDCSEVSLWVLIQILLKFWGWSWNICSWSSSFKKCETFNYKNKSFLICAQFPLLVEAQLFFSCKTAQSECHSPLRTMFRPPLKHKETGETGTLLPCLSIFYCFCCHGNTLLSHQIIIPLSKEERVGVPGVRWKTEEEDREYKYTRAVFFCVWTVIYYLHGRYCFPPVNITVWICLSSRRHPDCSRNITEVVLFARRWCQI